MADKRYQEVVKRLDQLIEEEATHLRNGRDEESPFFKIRIIPSHERMVEGINSALKIFAEVYGEKYEPLNPKL